MSYVLKILLTRNCFATFFERENNSMFLYSCCTASGFFLICTLWAYGEFNPFRPPNYLYLALCVFVCVMMKSSAPHGGRGGV
jgi:hypothetical protein